MTILFAGLNLRSIANMNKQEIIDFLKDNLSLSVSDEQDYYDKYVVIKLMLGEECISTEFINL